MGIPEEMNQISENDSEYQDFIIDRVRETEDGYELVFPSGWEFFMPSKEFVPCKGQTVRLYGKGIGYSVRGLVVNNRICFYRTIEEQVMGEEALRQKNKDADIKKYLDEEEKNNERINGLPPEFRERINGFRDYNPNWKYDYESYELFICEQAVAIAQAMRHSIPHGIETVQCASSDIDKFLEELYAASFVKQREMVNGLSNGHSCNSLYQAILLANAYIRCPAEIPKMHGALCELVGCKDYGCYAIRSRRLKPKTTASRSQNKCPVPRCPQNRTFQPSETAGMGRLGE